MPFSKLGLSDPILRAITELGYSQPTPIQEKAIPVILKGKNLLAGAQTGTGKTASFVLPILQMFAEMPKIRAKRVRALILTPTRELAVQVEDNIAKYAKYLPLTSMAMYGGVDSAPQKQRLIEGVDILVATPGRLLDMYTQRAIHFDEISVLVLDEADRMLDMGFIEDINKIIERLPTERQNLLFSATLSKQVRFLAKTAVENPVEIEIARDSANAPQIDQWLITVDKDKKSALLSKLITEQAWEQALIFIQTKQGAAKLVSQLEKRGIAAEAIHSGRSQAVREQLLVDFKSGKLRFLVATGVASRGIDIDALTRVVNYDLPDEADDYIHRIGRTGRAGACGEAISFVSKDDFRNLCAIERRLGHLIVRKEIEGFVPNKEVPVSILDFVPKNTTPKTFKARAPEARSSRPAKEGSFETAHAKKHRSAKSKPEVKANVTRQQSIQTDNGNETTGRSAPFNPWNSGPKTK
ncbi:DEAD/DEAH box helicase [Shewanella sp. SW36]|uniref:DEAD/DEAH box helicase n=1 Tax=Shewanella TaxID=22 RepID=UPI0021D86849|nr:MULTISPECIES: DEAD/DEAH box helicase [unclassified Shewanella]MCU7974123.1 DEAD/DEAH box helicase [Shewanella sp. SW36]MCU7989733.1 DEAD/DEAH box helicase [Shewanella sp. SW1]MCU8019093.1 DEAD/DEAH box helicase [Shewanella sp. SM72]MCU8050189.1 DEAD/DEAH box helicase [Shewanella sp. SM43]